MALTRKTLPQIKSFLAMGYANGGITNFNAGGVANTVIETQGDVVDELYDYGEACLLSGLVSNAAGEWLEKRAYERGLTRLAAVKTTGTVYCGRYTTSTTAYQIHTGDIVQTKKDLNGIRYQFLATADFELAAGELEVAVTVEASAEGVAWNVAVGAISEFGQTTPGFDYVENREDWITSEGADEESDDRLRARYVLAWDAATRGSTSAAYLLWALADIRVAVAWIDCNEPRGRGTINVYIIGTAGAPSPELLADVKEYIDAKRPGADYALVYAPYTRPGGIPLTFKIYRYANNDPVALEATVRDMLDAYFSPLGSELYTWIKPLGVGRKVVHSQLVEICTRPDSVYDVVFTDPTEDVVVAENELPELGTVTITHEEVSF